MPKKTRLTREHHDEMGRTLAGIRDELAHRAIQLGHAYPMSGADGTPHRKLGAAIRALDEARSALDSLLFRDYPDTAEPTVYYPHPEDRSVVIAPDRPLS